MNKEEYIKSHVSPNEWERIKSLDLNLDSRITADIWADFVNYEKRVANEIKDFLIPQLSNYKNPAILNAALGSGATTIGLLEEGFKNIISNEIDPHFMRVGKKEAREHGFELDVASYDWRNLPLRWNERFDAVLVLGNSLTYLFGRDEQLKALDNFRRVLKHNGKLIIDERNYQYHFLNGRDNFVYSGNYVYCGKDKVDAYPIYISNSLVIMEYLHKKTKAKCHIPIYPFKEGELESELKEVGFKEIKTYGDYKEVFSPQKPEFLTHVALK